MANRPVFIPVFDGPDLIEEKSFEFKWTPGMALEQKRKNIKALHEAAQEKGIQQILEISTRSTEKVGRRLSAFNLKISLQRGTFPLESVYQGSKVFKDLGAFREIYNYSPKEAKQFIKKCVPEDLIGFQFEGHKYPLEPRNAFYDWIYIKCLVNHADWIKENIQHDGFTDIEFNPTRLGNCQARAFAEYISLLERGKLQEAAKDFDTFVDILKSAK